MARVAPSACPTRTPLTVLCSSAQKMSNKTSPNEWLDAPTDADWTEFPAEGSAEGRGMGALDLHSRCGGSPR